MQYPQIDTNETKNMIAQTFIELLKTAAYSKISITSICKAIPLSRNTFYYHFESKEALVEWMVIQHFLRYSLPYFKFKENDIGSKMFFTYISKNKDFYNAVFKVDDGEFLRKCLITAYKIGMSPENLKEYAKEVVKEKHRIDARICAAYINSAIAGVIVFWIGDGMKISIDRIARDLTLLLTKSMEDIRDFHLY